MNEFLYDLKSQATIINGLVILLVLSFIFSRYHKKKAALLFLSISVIIFLLCSTFYLPKYLADKLERKYPVLILPIKNADTSKVLVLVLGSGYSLDKRLPANSQIGQCALGRLAEGIRIQRVIKNSIIICSGNALPDFETQAQVTKRAAIVLGVEADKIETLNEPGTTQEEAKELGRRYSKASKLIIVTDAIHMPRAITLFRKEGFDPRAAPTNYRIKEGPGRHEMQWWPSLENIDLMNNVIHEWLASFKASIAR